MIHHPWYLLVISVLLIAFLCVAVWGEESPIAYADRLQKELDAAVLHLKNVQLFGEHDYGVVPYIVKGERDVQLCALVLNAYRRGHVDRKHVEQLFRQLRKDLNTFPVVE